MSEQTWKELIHNPSVLVPEYVIDPETSYGAFLVVKDTHTGAANAELFTTSSARAHLCAKCIVVSKTSVLWGIISNGQRVCGLVIQRSCIEILNRKTNQLHNLLERITCAESNTFNTAEVKKHSSPARELRSQILPTGPYSSVGIATLYGLDGLGIESRWG